MCNRIYFPEHNRNFELCVFSLKSCKMTKAGTLGVLDRLAKCSEITELEYVCLVALFDRGYIYCICTGQQGIIGTSDDH